MGNFSFKQKAILRSLFCINVALCIYPLNVQALFAGDTVQKRDTLPHVCWEVQQVTIETNIGDKSKTAVYKTADEVKSILNCPFEWEIMNSQLILLRYPSGREGAFHYVFEENQLKITIGSSTQIYDCVKNDDHIVLKTVFNRYPANAEPFIEKWILILKWK